MDYPKISVVISSYNRFEALTLAIQSVKNQTYPNIEIIVINDCSTDPRYDDASCRPEGVIWLKTKINSFELKGFPYLGWVRNHGIKAMTGDYLAILDDDDYWFPSKLSIQINAMQKHKSQISCTDAYVGEGIYDAQKIYKHLYFRHWIRLGLRHESALSYGRLPRTINSTLLQDSNKVIHSTVLIYKGLIEKEGLPYKESKEVVGKEDWDYYIRLSKYSDILFIDRPLAYYDARDQYKKVIRGNRLHDKIWKYKIFDFFYDLFVK